MAKEKRFSKERNWTIGDGSNAITVKLEIWRDGKFPPNIIFEVGGLYHPYLEKNKRELHYMGDETKNPALLPAANFLMSEFGQVLEKKLQDKKYALSENLRSQGIPMLHGIGSYRTAGTVIKRDAVIFTDISDKKISTLFDALAAEMDAVMPQAKQRFEEYKHLQPDPHASDEVKDEVVKNVFRAHYRATNSAQEESDARGEGAQWVEMLNQAKRVDPDKEKGKHRWN